MATLLAAQNRVEFFCSSYTARIDWMYERHFDSPTLRVLVFLNLDPNDHFIKHGNCRVFGAWRSWHTYRIVFSIKLSVSFEHDQSF